MEVDVNALEKIATGLEKLRGITDTSFIEDLLNRFLKTKDEEISQFLFLRILKEYEKLIANFQLDDTLPNIRPKEGFEIGEIIYKGRAISKFNLSIEDINRNILIVGSTGHGKTSLIMNILKQAANSGLNYLVFDVKGDYKALGMLDNCVYISSEKLKVNPLASPTEVKEEEWAVHFSDIFSDSFSLLIGSRNYLMENLINLFSSWEESYPPSMKDLLNYINKFGIRNEYFKVVSSRIKALLSSSKIFECNYGINFDKLNAKNVVIGIETFGVAEAHFLVTLIMSNFYYSALYNKSKNFKRFFVIDDAHSILDINQEKDYAKGLPLLHLIISKIREFGFGFIFSDQQISSVLSSAIQNTNTKFIGRVNLIQDLYKLFPNEYKLESYFGNLQKGEFILLNENIYPFALFRNNVYSFDKDFDLGLLKIREKFNDELLSFFKAEEKDGKEIAFLTEISKNPFLNLTKHYSNLSDMMSKADFDEIRRKLTKEKIISEIKIAIDAEVSYKFLFIIKNYKDASNKLISYNEKEFFTILMKKLVSAHLKLNNINYQEENNGFLINGLIKTYILVNQSIEDLLRIMETSFDNILFLSNDRIKQDDVLAEVIKKGKETTLINIKSLKILHFADLKNTIK